jgi:hypothetical protein
MVDISLCHGEDCPSKNDCYRFRAEPDPIWQRWSNYDDLRHPTDQLCHAFLAIDRAENLLREIENPQQNQGGSNG